MFRSGLTADFTTLSGSPSSVNLVLRCDETEGNGACWGTIAIRLEARTVLEETFHGAGMQMTAWYKDRAISAGLSPLKTTSMCGAIKWRPWGFDRAVASSVQGGDASRGV